MPSSCRGDFQYDRFDTARGCPDGPWRLPAPGTDRLRRAEQQVRTGLRGSVQGGRFVTLRRRIGRSVLQAAERLRLHCRRRWQAPRRDCGRHPRYQHGRRLGIQSKRQCRVRVQWLGSPRRLQRGLEVIRRRDSRLHARTKPIRRPLHRPQPRGRARHPERRLLLWCGDGQGCTFIPSVPPGSAWNPSPTC